MKDKQPVKSIVLGRPILLALEDVDGTPSFLEKALRFIEEHGEFFCICARLMGTSAAVYHADSVARSLSKYRYILYMVKLLTF